jgi:hypothetical protein
MNQSCNECLLRPNLLDGWVGSCTEGSVIKRMAGKLTIVDGENPCSRFVDFRPTRLEKVLQDGYPL